MLVFLVVSIVFVTVLVIMFSFGIRSKPGHYRRNLFDIAYHGVRRALIQKGKLKINPKACEELLSIFKIVCDRHQVRFWLADGTALGAIRESRILPDDTDVDVCMEPMYWKSFHKHVVPDLLHQHKFCVIKDHAHYDFVTLAYRGQYLDVNSVVPGSYCMSVPGPCNDLIPHIGTIGEAKIGSKTYNVPSKEFLEFLYGPTWMKPRLRFKPVDAKIEMEKTAV